MQPFVQKYASYIEVCHHTVGSGKIAEKDNLPIILSCAHCNRYFDLKILFQALVKIKNIAILLTEI